MRAILGALPPLASRAPLPRFAALVPCLGLAVASTLVAWNDDMPPLRTPAPAVKLTPERVSGLESYACLSCHAEVGEEWATSAHGLAWLDESFQKDMKTKKRPELCHGCHIPEPVLAGVPTAKPETRAESLHLGIACESCHDDGTGTQLGPRGTATDAHPSKVSSYMSAPGSNELCSSCHSTNIGPVIGIAKDFAAAKLAERGLSCVGCHMAPLERAWATDAPVRLGRSHALQTPRDPGFLRLAFGLALDTSGGKTRVKLTNQAGHRVPGLVGRKLVFKAELLDAAGKKLEEQTLELDERAYLPVDATKELVFTKSGARVRVTGLHTDPRAKAPVPFLDETLAP